MPVSVANYVFSNFSSAVGNVAKSFWPSQFGMIGVPHQTSVQKRCISDKSTSLRVLGTKGYSPWLWDSAFHNPVGRRTLDISCCTKYLKSSMDHGSIVCLNWGVHFDSVSRGLTWRSTSSMWLSWGMCAHRGCWSIDSGWQGKPRVFVKFKDVALQHKSGKARTTKILSTSDSSKS